MAFKIPTNKDEAGKSTRKLTLHPGTKSEDRHLESQVYSWIIDQKDANLATCTTDIVDRVLPLNPRFKSMNQLTLTKWVYRLLKRHRLPIRICALVSQVTDATMKATRQDYCRRLMTSYRNQISDPHYLVSMDETAIYRNCFPERSVDVTREKNISIMIRGALSIRFMLAIIFSMDGTKLPLFVIFKGKPVGSVEKQITEIFPEGIIGCVQEKLWMDNRKMQIWNNEVYKPYIADADRKSGLLLGNFLCRKSQELTKKLIYDDSQLFMIPTHYTGLLQLCDVSINKSLKDLLNNKVAQWRGSKHANLNPGQKLSAPNILIYLIG